MISPAGGPSALPHKRPRPYGGGVSGVVYDTSSSPPTAAARLRRAIPAARASHLVGGLLLLGEVDGLALEHVQQRLARLQDLHVRGLRLLHRLVVFVPRLRLAHERLVDLLQAVGQERELLLDLALVLLLLHDLPVELLALLAQVLDALDELVVVVLERRTLGRHGF